MLTDVLIVGAGPTGLMLANQLARRGIRPTIIDRHAGPAEQTRAMAVHARTLEIYSKMGIAERAVAAGQRGDAANMWVDGRIKARIPVGEMGKGRSPFPYVLMLGQDENERILGEELRRQGVSIQWNTELIALEQQPDQVKVTIRDPDGGTRALSAAYVAGCDGSRSAVREMNRIAFPGAPYEHVFFVGDTEATGPMVPGELNVLLWPTGFHLFFPMRGTDRWRVIGILPKHLRGKDGLTFDELAPTLVQQGGAQQHGAKLAFKSCSWFSTYRIHHRVTEHFRDRRCFLAGDAAHVHSPMGGQGMNTGLQDAYNLAWKLALVIKGRANESLLDSYESERLPVAQRLLATTDRAFRFIVSESWIGGFFRTKIMPTFAAFAMTQERVRKTAFQGLSQIGIRYRHSPLSQDLDGLPSGAPRAGDRFPWMQLRLTPNGPVEDLFRRLDDTRFNLLVIGQPAPSAKGHGLGDLVDVHAIALDDDNAKALAAASITGPAFYLLRPDGHVGLAGTRFWESHVRRWLAKAGVRNDGSDAHHEEKLTQAI
jgi:2-polyprenyl-6-methoxyphenol hydroxylase-like FAD-dependent oxidoreductase